MTDNYFVGCHPKMGGFREMTSYYTNNINLINKILSEKVNLYTYRNYIYCFIL